PGPWYFGMCLTEDHDRRGGLLVIFVWPVFTWSILVLRRLLLQHAQCVAHMIQIALCRLVLWMSGEDAFVSGDSPAQGLDFGFELFVRHERGLLCDTIGIVEGGIGAQGRIPA